MPFLYLGGLILALVALSSFVVWLSDVMNGVAPNPFSRRERMRRQRMRRRRSNEDWVNPFSRQKTSKLAGEHRWPLPMWDLRWLWSDPIRRDLLVCLFVGAGAGVAMYALPNWTTGLLTVGVPFGLCFVMQMLRGLTRLSAWLRLLKTSSFGSLKVAAFWLALAGTTAVMAVLPWVGFGVALLLLYVRWDALISRPDVEILFLGASIWGVAFLSCGVLFRWFWVVVPLWSVCGLFVGYFMPSRGFRVGRLPLAMFEATTLVFGVLLSGASLVRTALIVAAAPPNSASVDAVTTTQHSAGGGMRDLNVQADVSFSKNPSTVSVGGYFRTVADGDPSNNFSANSGSSSRLVEYVRPHVRTAPDGVLENNLSYGDTVNPSGKSIPIRDISPSKTVNSGLRLGPRPDHIAAIVGPATLTSLAPNQTIVEDLRLRATRNPLWRPFLPLYRPSFVS